MGGMTCLGLASVRVSEGSNSVAKALSLPSSAPSEISLTLDLDLGGRERERELHRSMGLTFNQEKHRIEREINKQFNGLLWATPLTQHHVLSLVFLFSCLF